MHLTCILWATAWGFLANLFGTFAQAAYYGHPLGHLSSLHHGVSGEVFAVDSRTLHIRDFTYDGEGPAAYFYVGNTKEPSGPGGVRLNDEKGSSNPLPRYRKKHITLSLPEGKTLQNIRWFSVWCDEFAVNFGDVKIPKNLEIPNPQKLEGLRGIHGVSSEPIVIVDAQTLLLPSFSYDGEAPDAKFWVGRGAKPSSQGIRVADENGKEQPLRRYDRKTIVLTLPSDLTVFDIGHFGVWCEAFAVDFGHVRIPRNLNVPPSLKMLGVSPQSKLNCEVLWDDLAYEVRWALAGDSVVIQLVSKLDDGEYMSFGLSGSDSKTQMIGADVVVAWVDQRTLRGYAEDYYLDDKSQCSGLRGSCPDEILQEHSNSVRLLNAAMVNGYSIVTYQRPLTARDQLDRAVSLNSSQPIVWAIGPLNSKRQVSYHHNLYNKETVLIDFSRAPKWNCPLPESDSQIGLSQSQMSSLSNDNQQHHTQTVEVAATTRRPPATPAPAPRTGAWHIPPIQCNEPEDGVFYAQMGPTGGKKGYPAITGHVGWGISWYINGLLIPEINVVRGKTYTFVVEGGNDVDTPARYHPFYITDDPIGGYEHKTPEERSKVRIYAGVRRTRSGEVIPTGTGRLCNWTPDQSQPPAEEFSSFGAYQRTLTLDCEPGEPGVVTWTPGIETPDTVYYQCFTHRYLGWKINVLDDCDASSSASSPTGTLSAAPSQLEEDLDPYSEPLESHASIRVQTVIKPNSLLGHNKGFIEDVIFGDGETVTVPEPEVETTTTTTTSTTQAPVTKKQKIKEVIKTVTVIQPVPVPMGQPLRVRHPLRPYMHFPMGHTLRRPLPRPILAPNRLIMKHPQQQAQGSIAMPVVVRAPLHSKIRPRPVTVRSPLRPTLIPLMYIPQTTLAGFNPKTVVVEGGFKPIVEKRIDAQDRMDVDIDEENEETTDDSIKEIEDSEPVDNPFEGKVPEMFQPMFIPSPPDRITNLTKMGSTKVKHDVNDAEATAEEAREVPYYLPPQPPPTNGAGAPASYSQVLVTYEPKDGEIVPAGVLPLNVELPTRGSDRLRGLPQYGPFKGEKPPPVPSNVKIDDAPQLRPKRSPHHEPGHEGHGDDHDHHHHQPNSANMGTANFLGFIAIITFYLF